MSTELTDLISMTEAGKISGYHPDYLSALARQGKLDAKKIGRNWLVSKRALNIFLGQKEEETGTLVDVAGAPEEAVVAVGELLKRYEAVIAEKKYERHAQALQGQLKEVKFRLVEAHQQALREAQRLHALHNVATWQQGVHPRLGKLNAHTKVLGQALAVAAFVVAVLWLLFFWVTR